MSNGFEDSLSRMHPSLPESVKNTLFRISLFCFFFWTLGPIGFPFTYFLFFLWRKVIGYVYKIEYLSYFDKFYVHVDLSNSFNIGTVLVIENFNADKVKLKVEELFHKIPKLCASARVAFTEYCWNTPRVSLLNIVELDAIIAKRIRIVSIQESEFDQFVEKEANIPLDPFITPFEFIIISFTDNPSKGALYNKTDHCASDGLGIVSMLGFLDDEFSLDKYPSILRKSIPFHVNLLWTLKDYLIAFTYGCLVVLFTSATIKSIYNGFGRKVTTKKGRFLKGKTILLSEIKEASKKLKLTINEIYIAAFFSTLKELSPSSKKISLLIPMGFSSLPESTDKIQLYNQVSGFLGTVRLIDDVIKDTKIIKEDIRCLITSTYKISAYRILSYLSFGFINTRLLKFFVDSANIDCVITNVPGQEKQIKIGGGNLVSCFTACCPSTVKAFLAVGSYNGNVHMSIGVDENQELTPKQIMDLMYEKLIEVIQKTKTL